MDFGERKKAPAQELPESIHHDLPEEEKHAKVEEIDHKFTNPTGILDTDSKRATPILPPSSAPGRDASPQPGV